MIFIGNPKATRSELKIRIVFKRQYFYEITQSFLQSFMMGLLTYFTFWIDLNDFQDRCVLIKLLANLVKFKLKYVNRTDNIQRTYFQIYGSFDLFIGFGVIDVIFNRQAA